MIELHNVTKSFVVGNGRKYVARDISMVFPTGASVALLGRNGAGKSTLMQMISGAMNPDSGHIASSGTISWPVGFGGSFHGDMTGVQNIRFIARIYGVDTDQLCAFVEDFSELGDHFYMPIRTYSAGMRSRLAFGASMGIEFDTYLVDEVTAVGDANFRQKSRAVFMDRMQDSSAILVSHEMPQVRNFCDVGVVLDDGCLLYFDDLDEAIHYHHKVMSG